MRKTGFWGIIILVLAIYGGWVVFHKPAVNDAVRKGADLTEKAYQGAKDLVGE